MEGKKYSSLEEVKKKLAVEEENQLNTLFKLVRQPSISSQNIGIEECAALLKDIMQSSGIDTKIMETAGSPVVYGEVLHPDNELTILFYGHYDVQPPEPLELWDTPPFEPTILNGKIYGRGTGDNKGQLIAHVLAVKTLLELDGKLPVNVKFLFEGEEENASANLAAFVETNRELLKADVAYTADGPMEGDNKPSVRLGNRGLLYIKLTATGAIRDNHSGNKGNIAPNPALELIHLIATMYTPNGKILIDNFYDDLRVPTEEELEHLRHLPFDAEVSAKTAGIESLDMDSETYYRRLSLEPTFNINGLYSGYTGEGQKTIIPSVAVAKIDLRLAADQDPDKIYLKIQEHVKKHSTRVTVEKMGRVKPSRTPMSLEIVQKIVHSVEKAHDETPVVTLAAGGTGPQYVFTDILNIPSVQVPYANVDEDNHAPNENMGVKEYLNGVRTSCSVLLNLGE